VHWAVVRAIALGWIVTLPVTALFAATLVGAWEAVS